MRVLELRVSNVKRIRAVEIKPNPSDPIVKIGGANGQGKSSTIDAIMFALAGKRAQGLKPVRIGENSAYVELDMGDLKVRRTWRPDSDELRVSRPDGATVSKPQDHLNAIISQIAFDPLGFADLEGPKQEAMLASLVGLDIEAYRGRRRGMMDRRLEANKEGDREQAAARSLGAVTGAKPIDEAPIRERLLAIRAGADAASAWDARRSELSRAANAAGERVGAMRDRVDRLRRELAAAEEEEARSVAALSAAAAAAAAHEATTRPTVEAADAILADLSKAQANNERVKVEASAKAHGDRAAGHYDRARAITAEIEQADADWARAMENATWPIAGLAFTEDGVVYKGVPLSQCSSAERIRVACSVGIAMGKDIRVLLVREGSLLDEKSVGVIREIAAKHDFQVWMERVGDEPDAVIIEDGQVARVPASAGV